MVWKKVSNSDAGDSSHFGGDDIDKISDTFNAGTQTDPINIKDVNLYVVDPADTSKKVRFDAGGVTSSNTRVITLPDADITIGVASSSSVAGLMSAADKTKLDAIEASATADQTDAEIRTAVEAATDSNVFTDADHSKLNAIEASATADQSNGEIKTAYEANSDTNAFTDANVTTLGNRAPLASPTFTGTVNAADVTLSGNLTVNGSTTTVNTATLSVEDPLIKLASGNNAADSVDVGFYGLYDVGGTDKYAGIVRDASDSGKFIAFKDLQTEPTTTVDKTATGYTKATIVADIEGNADTATTVADDAIGITQLAGIARGKIIVGDASGNPALLSAGANDTVLTMDASGDVGWEAAAEASPLTTKGDVYVHTGSANARLGVGADGKALKADSTAPTGLVWGDAGGSAPTLILEPSTDNTTPYTGTNSAGTGISVGTAVGTEAAGVGQREIYIRKIDTNNEGVFTVIHKNGAAVEVQIA